MVPDDRKYTTSHEWIKIEGKDAIVGITDYAQEQLGDITFIDFPEEEEYKQDSECAVIESVKAASDIYAPIDGNIVEVNKALSERPELVNEDSFNEGWIFKMRDYNAEQVDELMDSSEYEAMLESEE